MTVALSRTSRHRPGRGGWCLIIPGFGPFLLLGCVAAEAVPSEAAATYHCENGTFFSAEFLDRSARVTTLRQSYLLEQRPSSIGRKYSTGNVFFIQDEDRGVLVGAADGPYQRCAER